MIKSGLPQSDLAEMHKMHKMPRPMQPARIKPHAKEHTNNPVREMVELWSILLNHHLHERVL